MTNKLYLQINGNEVDVLEGSDFEFRLNRFVQDVQNFQVKGGDTSYPLDIPFTKNNSKILNVSYSHQAINKFNRDVPYSFSLGFNGVQLLSGTVIINEITPNSINIEFRGESIDWIQKLEETPLNRLGYVNDLPTWFGGNRLGQVFEGGDTISLVNDLNNRQTDYICPTVIRYNTPITDYLNEEFADIFGLQDSGGNQVLAPKEYPDSFLTSRGYLGQRQGLTFEDFPPAIYFRNLIEKCFEEVNYSVDCTLFNEDWFNRLYIPYQGEDFYKYNWKTLAELEVRFSAPRVINELSTAVITDIEVDSITLIGSPANKGYYFRHRLGNSDDVSQRVDKVANFNKFLVSDETNGYVVPAKGKYKIRVKTDFFKRHTDNVNIAGIGVYDILAGTGRSWSDTVFVILRKSPEGTTLLREDPLRDVTSWMSGQFDFFISTPSDIIAFYSPYQATVYGSSQDPNASGSPLTNFQTPVTVTSGTYSSTIVSSTVVEATATADFEIEVDLLMNERVEFYAVTLGLFQNLGVNEMDIYDAEINDVSSLIDIDYICGDEDISLADNLPEITAKDMIRNFINTFNLRWVVNGNSINFIDEKRFFNNDFPYDITDRVDVNTVRYTPTMPAKNVVIGYNNDTEDNELNILISDCIEDNRNATNYANRTSFDNPNIYARDIQNFQNGFSATRFIEGDLSDLADFNNLSLTITNISLPFPIPFYNNFIKGRTFAPNKSNNLFRMPLPSVQSIISVEERTVGDLNYTFNQGLRLLQHFGTAGYIYDTELAIQKDLRFIIGAPENAVCLESKYWIRPTYSSFDFEQPSYSSFATPSNTSVPTQSMRYDVTNGLYDKFFTDVTELTNKSYVFTCQAYLRSIDWNSLQPNRTIKYLDGLYRLLEISDYDVNGIEPCTLKMIKI